MTDLRPSRWLCVVAVVLALASLFSLPSLSAADVASAASDSTASDPTDAPEESEEDEEELQTGQPWDYSPYRVLIWIASRDARINAQTVHHSLAEYLDRDFNSIWRTTITDAPASVQTAAFRSMDDLTYDQIAASDPVIAVKRDHEDAIRIQTVKSLPRYVQAVPVTSGTRNDVLRRAEAFGDPSLGGAASVLKTFDGDALALAKTWNDPSTEAMLVTRGKASTFEKPGAKILTLPITELVETAVEEYDKIFVVRVDGPSTSPTRRPSVTVAELETLMRYFGAPVTTPYSGPHDLASVIGYTVTEAFAPMVRIDDAGQDTATGMVRAANLILDPESPAAVPVGSALMPMIRKNNREGNPISIGPIEWAYLIATEKDGRDIKMDYYSGRPGGLQGRKNKRTFKMAMLLHPQDDSTLLRLHAKGREDEPLIGYELYERELNSKSMTFVGRTDWNGRLAIQKTDNPLRLLYVKNGGAVLARLPMVPGLTEMEVADLSGDDMRLQAEAYIRGVQNAIVDLVAIRKLLAARIRLRLREGKMKEAEDLLNALREQPTNEQLANDMGKKQGDFLKAIGNRNVNQRRKVDDMFKVTREMLGKQINPAVIRDLEADVNAARDNGGKLPAEEEDQPETQDASQG
ncbi:hypothetical protein FYK55_19080 [Roseiconus nitratireducens]|uniref:Uncharacterized protein n=1 Tax=Roseiconus nitratireducens TaxID=2605748 RepID=A0A5M6D0N7_9BACT|nr:hypothetical protein [Roseiconus nitratireducens]KAA5541004.1 hypothetical protein FYK55_19080 [Roseiconus nitratireducens]